MKQAFCLFIAVVFLFGAAVVHGSVPATLQSIDCSDASSISFDIYIPDIDEWEGSTDQRSWSVNSIDNDACEPTFDRDKNLVSYTDIDVSLCHEGNPAITPDGSKFEYEFKISVDAVAGSATEPVTFAYDHDYVIKCFYNRDKENIGASFQPLHSLAASGSGVGDDFTIEFTVHFRSTGLQINSIVDLSTSVFGKIEITDPSGIPQNLDVHLREVTADIDDSPTGDEFALIENGCAKPPVVTETTCNSDPDEKFFFNIFRFPGQSNDDKVYLRAKVIVCLKSNTESVCRTECDACPENRNRRDTLGQVQQTEFYVTARPFQIRELDDQEEESEAVADEDERTPFPAYVIAVVAVCGTLAVAIVSAVVFIVLRRRRQNVANIELWTEDTVTA